MESRLAAREAVQIPTAMMPQPSAAVETDTWLPDDLASLLAWIRRIASELSRCDPCAPAVPSGKTDAELALELASPMQRCQLGYSTEPGGAPQAQRLVPVLQRLLAELERRRQAIDDHLQELPPLLHKLAMHGGPALQRAAQLPPSLALALLALPNAAPASSIGDGGGGGGGGARGGGGGGEGGGGGGGGEGGGVTSVAVAVSSSVAIGAANPPVATRSTKDELAHGGALGGKAYRESARRLLRVLQHWHGQPHKLATLMQHPPRLRRQEIARIPTRLRAAIVAATAAAAALCQSVRWAEAKLGIEAAEGDLMSAQQQRQLAVDQALLGGGGEQDGTGWGEGGDGGQMADEATVALGASGEPIVPSLGLAAAGIGVARDDHARDKDRVSVHDKLREEARAKAARAGAATPAPAADLPASQRIGSVHARWLHELNESGLWGADFGAAWLEASLRRAQQRRYGRRRCSPGCSGSGRGRGAAAAARCVA